MKRKDLLLVFLFGRGKTLSDNEKIPTETHLQKEMFLLMKETLYSETKEYDFTPHYYGPFSSDLRIDLDNFVFSGMVEEHEGISLTPRGFNKASSLWRDLEEVKQRAIIRIKETYNFKSLNDLLAYVYKKFPKYTVNSALRMDVLYSYFDKFYEDNSLSEEYLMHSYNRIRYPEQ